MTPDKILPRPITVATATKFKKKSPITRLVQEMPPRCVRLPGGSPGQAIKWCQSNFNRTDPGCHGNEIWYKTGYSNRI